MSERRVTFSVSWDGNVTTDVESAIGWEWPADLPFTAENVVTQLRHTETGLAYRPSDFVEDIGLLDTSQLVIDVEVRGEDGTWTVARWAQVG